ncbi:MAG: extracellular solute-binding protein, partial [Chloroflexota bacterium]|nr:extracellular solute-binding protein [Chloroflexota bacterium]
TSGLRDPGAVQALQLWQDAIESGVAPRSMLGNGGGDIVANLAAGYCAMQNIGIWGISAMRENAPDFEYGVFPLPTPPDGEYASVLGGWAFVANAQGRNPDLAAEFCVWALGSMSDDSIDRVVDWCINAKSDMPPRQSVVDRTTETGGYESGPLQIFRDEILPGARAEPRVTPEVYRPIADAIQATMLNGADAQEAGEQAAQQIEAFLAGYQGAPIL